MNWQREVARVWLVPNEERGDREDGVEGRRKKEGYANELELGG